MAISAERNGIVKPESKRLTHNGREHRQSLIPGTPGLHAPQLAPLEEPGPAPSLDTNIVPQSAGETSLRKRIIHDDSQPTPSGKTADLKPSREPDGKMAGKHSQNGKLGADNEFDMRDELDDELKVMDVGELDSLASKGVPEEDLEEAPEEYSAGLQIKKQEEKGGSETATEIYLREISRVPLLTAEDEITLAMQCEAGRVASSTLGSDQQLDQDTMVRLKDKINAGDAARQRMMEANLRLVVAVARKYMGRGVLLLDLIQEGNIGLSRAVERFDYRKGFKFSTYAYWWIRQAVTRAIANQSRTIRIPVHVIEDTNHVNNTGANLQQVLGREPTPEEIAEEMRLKPEKVRQILRAVRPVESLEKPLSDDEEGDTLGDLIPDPRSDTAEEGERNVFTQQVRDALKIYLDDREIKVLTLRFGIDQEDDVDNTLKEIGNELGVTRERVRQIESRALNKLRKNSEARRLLKNFL